MDWQRIRAGHYVSREWIIEQQDVYSAQHNRWAIYQAKVFRGRAATLAQAKRRAAEMKGG